MNKLNFASIEEIPLKSHFKREDKDFTPWLQENIQLLGEAIGIDILDAETEIPIGNYRLDILANESGTNRKIAIENQFETTNHSHLGQLITYMAGADADVVVWVAESFREEHLTAINHLNQISNKEIAFFCIRPRLIRIDNSDPALEFVVVTKPDEWEKSVTTSSKQFSPREMEYKKFWDQLATIYSNLCSDFKVKNPYPQGWLWFGAGKSGLFYSWAFKPQKFVVELYINTRDAKTNDKIYAQFLKEKEHIEEKLGKLEWFRLENLKKRTISMNKDIEDDILTLKNKEDLIQWAVENMEKFREVFDLKIKDLE
ncbi:MAG: DUF4268 domain-containing protein [Methanobacteriaceae archaeon]|nr:DUF4268 domain-containing protein [Methanobacteriaceae archaeon]